ncbi:HAD family hydrolase [Brachybacterium kimchii]|uniref:HAD family hydrolase n=1 Tax=Brachybacterium kimchii TaxID=2942909 RepID=A0ABY4N8S2_9MICO|nr:HAD family hydrolase [Brachybacterium kimchii]UQN30943.1 HAD family hydrolase [Brachybacterium kimchii]
MIPDTPPLSTSLHPAGGPVVVFDFDGTVCLGDGPVLAYAEAACARMQADDARSVRSRFEDWMAGRSSDHHADAYVALAALARPILGAELSEAYLDSRRRLVHDDLGVRPPEGLLDLLDELSEAGVRRALLTNSPAVGMDETLVHLGVRGRFDQIVVGAKKPSRMPEHLRAVLGDEPAHHLVSIGDNWRNDVAPAVDLGAVGMLITGAWGDSALPPQALAVQRGHQLSELLPALRRFAADAEAFAPSRDLAR